MTNLNPARFELLRELASESDRQETVFERRTFDLNVICEVEAPLEGTPVEPAAELNEPGFLKRVATAIADVTPTRETIEKPIGAAGRRPKHFRSNAGSGIDGTVATAAVFHFSAPVRTRSAAKPSKKTSQRIKRTTDETPVRWLMRASDAHRKAQTILFRRVFRQKSVQADIAP